MNIQPITLTGRTIRLEPLERRHAADMAQAADSDTFRYHGLQPELSQEGLEAYIDTLLSRPAMVPVAWEGDAAGAVPWAKAAAPVRSSATQVVRRVSGFLGMVFSHDTRSSKQECRHYCNWRKLLFGKRLPGRIERVAHA